MADLAGRCNCGRKIRYPKHATYGDKWACWKCRELGLSQRMAVHCTTNGRKLHHLCSIGPIGQ